MPKVLILNGPNLNLLGRREPDIYGHETLGDIEAKCRQLAAGHDMELDWFQSNFEGELIEKIQQAVGKMQWIIINAAGPNNIHYMTAEEILTFGILNP